MGNNISTGISASPLHITDISFLDNVSASMVNYDTVTLGNDYLLHKKYAFVTTGSQCASSTIFQEYTGTMTINNAFLYNGKYFCAYGEDASGSGRYLLSSSSFSLDPNMPSIVFSDPVSSGAVLSDSISVQPL
jgi:hypothetical protein